MKFNRDSSGESCPVSDDMLGQLYRSSKDGLPRLIETVSPDIRAALASYCYRRAHLKGIGLAIASTCDEHDLVMWGGNAGAALYARSREASAERKSAPSPASRQKITLATGSLRASLPIDEDPDPDVDASDVDASDVDAVEVEPEPGPPDAA